MKKYATNPTKGSHVSSNLMQRAEIMSEKHDFCVIFNISLDTSIRE